MPKLMKQQNISWKTFDDGGALRQAAFDAVMQCAANAIAERGRFLIVLAGGNTPRDVYAMLREAPTDWSKWHVYYGDERCLAADHADRNSRMAEDSWLRHVAIPAQQVHAIPAELGPDLAAQAYHAVLADAGVFDLVLLGLGEDGHTASLFPGQAWDGGAGEAAIAVRNAPKPPPERVSISASRLSQARRVIFLATGAGKREAIGQWRSGVALPAAAIRPQAGVEVYMDAAAEPGA